MEKKKLSHIVQDKIKEVENKIVPGVSWDKQKSWEKIREMLASKNKQLLLWYFATAASVSVLMAASLDTTLPYLEKFLDTTVATQSIENESTAKISTPVFGDRKIHDTSEIELKTLNRNNRLYSAKCQKNNIKKIEHPVSKPTSYRRKKSADKPTSLVFIPQLNSNTAGSVAPGVSFDFRHYLKNSDYKSTYIAIGVSTNFIYQSGGEGRQNMIYPATFVNAKYGQTKMRNDKNNEWEIGAGYLLNPNQVIYKDTTVRFHYLKTVTGKLKAGPELILTNNMTKLYPGFTLAFG